MIKAVIYDLDNTVYDFESVLPLAMENMVQLACARLNVTPQAFSDAFDASLRLVQENVPPEIRALKPDSTQVSVEHNRLVRLAETMSLLSRPIFPYALELYDAFWNTILDNVHTEPHLAQTLDALKERGMIVGVGSNMTARMQYLKIEKTGLGPYFDFVTVSEESIIDKPDPRFFQLVVTKASQAAVRKGGAPLLPEECLFVGDHYYLDYLGARKAGLLSLWYHRIESSWSAPSAKDRQCAREALRHAYTDHLDILQYLSDPQKLA